MPTNGRRILHRGFTIQTDYRDSEAQTDPTTLGKSNTQFECTCEMALYYNSNCDSNVDISFLFSYSRICL